MIYENVVIVCLQPLLSPISVLFAESQFNCLAILFITKFKPDFMKLNLFEILLCLCISASPQPFIILNLPPFLSSPPLFILVEGEEQLHFIPFPRLHYRCHKLSDEPRILGKLWPEIADKIDHESLDMRPIVILISHYHDASISQFPSILEFLANLKPHDLDY